MTSVFEVAVLTPEKAVAKIGSDIFKHVRMMPGMNVVDFKNTVIQVVDT